MILTGNIGLGVIIGIATVGANIIAFVPRMGPLRWMLPGLVLATIFVIYPIYYTVYTAFTNYGDGNLLTEAQAVDLITNRQFVPEDALTYDWVLYRGEDNPESYALWMTRTTENGQLEVIFAPQGEEIIEVDTADAEAPPAYDGYVQMSRAELAPLIAQIQALTFGTEDDGAGIRNVREAARPLVDLYTWDPEARTLLNNQTGVLYSANNEIGRFVADNGDQISPGYRVWIGSENFSRAFQDNIRTEAFNNPELNFFQGFQRAFSGPLIIIFIWTIVFAFLSVFTTFWVGLFMAIILNDANIPGKKIIRSLLIIPYAIPGVIAIVVWRGMLNQNLGIITTTIAEWTGYSIPWFADAAWARLAIVIVNLWLGYPYMMLICSGALQAIPSDIYEAAAVDGASPSDRFWKITLPLLLVTVGPLLIASFVFNFNNFLLIDALTAGNPPILESDRPAGYTDILISYVYRLAFGNSRGADYGYASAITIIIFFIVAAITMFQYRFTKQWEEVGENV
ncbi:MAG: ABC transporter permease subunit [Anaerolineae bacterium]